MQVKANSKEAWRTLALPPHYQPETVGEVWLVPYQERAQQAKEWARQQHLRLAENDPIKIALVLIDLQNTFCIPEFELFVGGLSGVGAIEDNRRLCEFIYRNLDSITHITATLDTHRAMQIFHPVFLVDENGQHPAPHTLVTQQDIQSGRWKFNPQVAKSLGVSSEAGQQHLLHYTRTLKQQGKYDLTIWPYHAMLGGIGHALVPAVEEAIFFHTLARGSQAEFEIKGQIAMTENYSAIGPDVLAKSDGEPLGEKTLRLMQTVVEYDAMIIAGQAKSHCVAWTIGDLLEQIQAEDARLARKVYLLEDCTSPVVVPGVMDYSPQADQAFQRFAQAGMHLVRSSRPLAEWIEITKLD